MQNAVIEILRGSSGQKLKTLGTGKSGPDLYLSGMQAIGLKTDGQLLPAGPLEIIASGGLDTEQYERIGEVTVGQSHIASLYDTIVDVVPRDSDFSRAKIEITKLAHAAVGGKIVSISMD